MVKQFLVKDFHHFVDRSSRKVTEQFFNLGTIVDQVWNRSLIMTRGWSLGLQRSAKRLRPASMNAAGKLRQK